MTWDLDEKKVFFAQKKKDRYLGKIAHWVIGSPVTRKEVESVIGTLNHCSLILVAAPTHLPPLMSLLVLCPGILTFCNILRHIFTSL
jgi:hypothetical protein